VRYASEFFDAFAEGSRTAAAEVVPLVLDLVGPVRSVLDVGCGIGTWLSAFTEHGVDDLVGVDGDYVDRGQLLVPPELFVAHDLTEPLRLGRTFDLVISLEVAEHVAAARARTFVGSLCDHASEAVLFSAAPPGQGGKHHVNEQWPSYWIELFAERGFEAFDVVRPRVWENARVEWWYRQNTFLFARGAVAERVAGADTVHLTDVVHPAGARQTLADVTWHLLPERLVVTLRRAKRAIGGGAGSQ
jgi:SAM-dependent methyltransferase